MQYYKTAGHSLAGLTFSSVFSGLSLEIPVIPFYHDPTIVLELPIALPGGYNVITAIAVMLTVGTDNDAVASLASWLSFLYCIAADPADRCYEVLLPVLSHLSFVSIYSFITCTREKCMFF